MILIVNNGQVTGRIRNTRQLDGEKIPGDLRSWDYFGTDPNEILRLTYGILSERSATLYHTHPPVCAAVNKTTSYAIGSGLVFRSQPDWETLGMTKESAKAWSMRFQKLIHYAFMALNFYEKQGTLFRTGLIQGDSLLMFDYATAPDGLPFDLVEAGGDYIDFKAVGRGNENVTLGVVHDKFLRRQGLRFVDNAATTPFRASDGAQNVVQFFIKSLARQLRGYPLAYRIISSAKNNDRFWDATLQRAVMETIMLGHSESETENPAEQARALADSFRAQRAGNAEPGTEATSNVKTEATVNELGGGNILSFRKGGIKFTDLKTPSNNFDKMQTAYIDLVGMATDVPPEVILSKYSTSYTAHKGALNDFIRFYMAKRGTFAQTVGVPVVRELARYLFTERLIELPHPDYFRNPIIQMAALAGKWLGPVPGHINPLQEVQAKKEEVAQSFRLRSDAAADYGTEWENAIEQWIEEETEFRKISPAEQAKAVANSLEEDDDAEPKKPEEVIEE